MSSMRTTLDSQGEDCLAATYIRTCRNGQKNSGCEDTGSGKQVQVINVVCMLHKIYHDYYKSRRVLCCTQCEGTVV